MTAGVAKRTPLIWRGERVSPGTVDLLVMMPARSRASGRFGDLDRLTLFADNLVPHVLRWDGLLRYAPALGARIDREELVLAGSPEEVEIRASAVHAVELLVAELRKLGHQTTAAQLDYLLWNRGQQPYYKARPRHRTRSVSY